MSRIIVLLVVHGILIQARRLVIELRDVVSMRCIRAGFIVHLAYIIVTGICKNICFVRGVKIFFQIPKSVLC